LGIALIGLFFTGETRSPLLGSLFFVLGVLLYVADRVNVVEIREKGIIVDGGFYPWDQLRGYRWDEGKIPTLILRFSRYTSRFGIAPEQKDLIQGILQEHVQSATTSQQPQSLAAPGQPGG
jgi:hypothetical protein